MSTTRIVEIILRWMEEGGDIASHIGLRVKYLNDVSAELGKRLGVTKQELVDTFINTAADSASRVRGLVSEVEEFGGALAEMTPESAAWLILMDDLEDRFGKSKASTKKLNTVFNELARDWGTNARDISNRIIEYSQVVRNEHVKISKSVDGVVDKQEDWEKSGKDLEKTASESDLLKIWQGWAKAQYDAAASAVANDKALTNAIETAAKNKGVINETIAAEFKRLREGRKEDEWLKEIDKRYRKVLTTKKKS